MSDFYQLLSLADAGSLILGFLSGKVGPLGVVSELALSDPQ